MKSLIMSLMLILSISSFAGEIIDLTPKTDQLTLAANGSVFLLKDTSAFRYDPQCENCGSEDQARQRSQDHVKSLAMEICKNVQAKAVEIININTSVDFQKDYLLNIGAPRLFHSSANIRCIIK